MPRLRSADGRMRPPLHLPKRKARGAKLVAHGTTISSLCRRSLSTTGDVHPTGGCVGTDAFVRPAERKRGVSRLKAGE